LVELARERRRIGRGSGLDAVGITDAATFEAARRAILERRADGRSAGMQFVYRNPDRSTDPAATLPGVQAIVVGAQSYLRAEPASQEAPDVDARRSRGGRARGGVADGAGGGAAGGVGGGAGEDRPLARIARYSWIDHYAPLRRALAPVADRLVAAGWRARVVADDNALVDRAAAHRAGLGWYGTNTNLLLPGAGSWFVLGSVLTDAPLTPDPGPVPDGCGPCRRCVPACPTGALSADEVTGGALDARRCLAWLLQAEGVFPAEHRVALGDRIYGCDECQAVCPVNKVSARRRPPPVAEATAAARADVLSILAAGDAELLETYGRWYIPRRQPRYLRRNALIVLGNVGRPDDREARAALTRAVADTDPLIRAHAVWAAARLGCDDLVEGAAGDPDPMVRAEVAHRPPPRLLGSGAR
ncbi:MAG: epoxyqueuosine reductase, partial [Acidimicrobiales bacterium]